MPCKNQLLPNTLIKQIDQLSKEWKSILLKPEIFLILKRINSYIEKQLEKNITIYPERPFRALEEINIHDIRVVILGQDPYHQPGQAQGLAFSVPNDCKRPPSLHNIFKEIKHENPNIKKRNELIPWVKQGVLLLNTILTVEKGKPGIHAKCGWEDITDILIREIARDSFPKVFMLWGKHAKNKRNLLKFNHNHLILMASHPSPISYKSTLNPFYGCNHFQKTNEWFLKNGKTAINWVIN